MLGRIACSKCKALMDYQWVTAGYTKSKSYTADVRECKNPSFLNRMYVGTPLGSDDARQLVALEREKSIARHQLGGSPVGSKGRVRRVKGATVDGMVGGKRRWTSGMAGSRLG